MWLHHTGLVLSAAASIVQLAPAGGRPVGPREAVPLAATAVIAGKTFEFSGTGECQHTDEGSIYEAPAAMWHASFTAPSNPLSRLNLSLWQLKGGGPVQVTMTVQAGSATHEIATMKGGVVRGSATGRVERRGAGGTLSIEGRTVAGKVVHIAIVCSRFTAPEDNG